MEAGITDHVWDLRELISWSHKASGVGCCSTS